LEEELKIPFTEYHRCILVCPFCKGQNLHIIEVSVHRGEDLVTVTRKRISIEEMKNEHRGVIITIEYEGECGHHGQIELHFYKGNTFVYNVPLPDITDGKDLLHYSEKGDIFRD
jgi:uncharacterized protein YbaR (Trm112 family)